MISEKSSSNEAWIVFYQAPNGGEIMSEITTDLPATVSRIQSAGNFVIVIEDIIVG